MLGEKHNRSKEEPYIENENPNKKKKNRKREFPRKIPDT